MEPIYDCDSQFKTEFQFPQHEQALRSAIEWIRFRHDGGAISPAVFAVIRMIETEISWLQHRGQP